MFKKKQPVQQQQQPIPQQQYQQQPLPTSRQPMPVMQQFDEGDGQEQADEEFVPTEQNKQFQRETDEYGQYQPQQNQQTNQEQQQAPAQPIQRQQQVQQKQPVQEPAAPVEPTVDLNFTLTEVQRILVAIESLDQYQLAKKLEFVNGYVELYDALAEWYFQNK